MFYLYFSLFNKNIHEVKNIAIRIVSCHTYRDTYHIVKMCIVTSLDGSGQPQGQPQGHTHCRSLGRGGCDLRPDRLTFYLLMAVDVILPGSQGLKPPIGFIHFL